MMSSCTEFTFSSTPTQAPSPLPLQGRQRKESLGSIDLYMYMFALKFILPHVVSFSIKTEQSARLAQQTRNIFDIRRLPNFVFMMILSVAMNSNSIIA